MKKILFYLVFLCTIFGACNSTSKTQNKGELLWEISGNGLEKPSYLLGTWHSNQEFNHPLFLDSIQGLYEVLTNVKQYAGEAAFSQDEYLEIHQESILMPADTSYSDILSEEDTKTLDMALYSLFKTNTRNINLRPYHLSQILVKAYRQKGIGKLSLDSEAVNISLMDIDLERIALNKDLDIIALDDAQTLALAHRPLKEELAELVWLIETQSTETPQHIIANYTGDLLNAYLSQDMGKIEKELGKIHAEICDSLGLDSSMVNNYFDQALVHRNRLWLPKIEDLIHNESTLVAVGIRHLPEETGLINLLREKGYTVQKWGN